MTKEEKQEVGKATCVFLYNKQKKMATMLVKSGHYKNISELVRANIENDFKEKMGNPKEELKREKEKLEGIIKDLEERIGTVDDALDGLVTEYKERKNNIPAKAMGKYEKFSKNWIATHMDEATLAFPGKSSDEIYEELERMIKV
jgi:Arc/MetJ-type ribon-helix-helix transcriptional regulator